MGGEQLQFRNHQTSLRWVLNHPTWRSVKHSLRRENRLNMTMSQPTKRLSGSTLHQASKKVIHATGPFSSSWSGRAAFTVRCFLLGRTLRRIEATALFEQSFLAKARPSFILLNLVPFSEQYANGTFETPKFHRPMSALPHAHRIHPHFVRKLSSP